MFPSGPFLANFHYSERIAKKSIISKRYLLKFPKCWRRWSSRTTLWYRVVNVKWRRTPKLRYNIPSTKLTSSRPFENTPLWENDQ
jgi:hypothetical protein